MIAKNTFNWQQITTGLLGSLIVLTVVISPAVNAKGKTPEATTSNYYWYDGSERRTLKMDAGMVAEVATGASDSVVANSIASATEVKAGTGGMRLWDVSSSGGASKALSTLKAANVSPVFHDSAGTSSRLALPGGIIVTFKDDWDAQRVQEWVSAQGLNIQNKLNFGNIYVIATDVGMSALTLANQIHESGEVAAAQPNWWKEYRHQ